MQCTRRHLPQFGRRSKSSKPVFRVGLEVDARYKGASSYYPGRIETVNRDGTFDIAYADGDHEKGVRKEHIRRSTMATKKLNRLAFPRLSKNSSISSAQELETLTSFRLEPHGLSSIPEQATDEETKNAPAKTIHIEHPLRYGGKKATFIVDLYHTGTDPGYSTVLETSGPVGLVVVTRVVEGEVTHVWVEEDKDSLANEARLTAEQVVNSRIFVGDILEVLMEKRESYEPIEPGNSS